MKFPTFASSASLGVFFLLAVNTLAQNCADQSGCQVCLESSNDCIFHLGACSDECGQDPNGPPQETCYSRASFEGNIPASGICDLVTADIQLCQQNSDSCESCTSAVKSDGSSCQWYSLPAACFGGGTGPFGSGELTCGGEETEEPVVEETDEPTPAPTENPTEAPVEETEAPTPTPTEALVEKTEPPVTEAPTVAPTQEEVVVTDAPTAPEVAETDAPTAPEIVETEAPVVQDDDCVAATDCGSCTSSGCFWYSDEEVCASTECNEVSICGAAECPASPESICEEAAAGGCDSCLDSLCAWFPDIGACEVSCDMVADTSCYSANTFPDLGSTEICAAATANEDDSELCFSQLECGACTSTALISDATQMCQWYFDEDTGIEWCQTGGCNMNGICGSDTCGAVEEGATTETDNPVATDSPIVTESPVVTDSPVGTDSPVDTSMGEGENITDTDSPCTAFDGYGADGCEPCLESAEGCVWILGSCATSCDAIADAKCFESSLYDADTTISEICDMASGSNDEAVCVSKNYCFTCTSTAKSDGEMCAWYKDEDSGEEWCGVGGCDANGICGASNEEVCQMTDATGNAGIGATTTSPEIVANAANAASEASPPAFMRTIAITAAATFLASLAI